MYVSIPAAPATARRWGHDLACVELGGGTAIVLTSVADARALTEAAAEAERLLTTAALAASIDAGTPVVIVEDEPERVPDPTGLCGHPVTPGAWRHGHAVCRACLTDPAAVALYDQAIALYEQAVSA